MSNWQDHINRLINNGKVTKALIFGANNGVWANSTDYNLSEGERKEILAKFDNLNHEGAQQEVALAQRKFPIVRVDGNKLYGKISGVGCVLVKTKPAVLVVEYSPPVQAPEVIIAVQNLVDNLAGASI